ncbi:hypothetical protein [Chryseobacterium lactis]|uniref:hypothetical protein n=2 Tax=Chryseobacterium TaxID=59732 RepID=UPI00162399AC|nr:hypothetical protein [Chryseobacterium lactis]
MSSYLPDKTYVVCTNQLGVEYKQLTLSENRSAKTVQLGSQSRVFLVVLDKNLTEDFTCKSGWSSGAGTAAVGAGVIVGMAATVGVGLASGLTVAAAVAVIPGIGWIAGGLIAVGCLAYGIWQMMKSPTCSQMIGYEESKWINYHPTVRFDSSNVSLKEKHKALVKNSILKCKEPGGMLLPFISESSAKQAAEAIGYNNRRELATNAAAGFLTGFLLGTGIGGAGAAAGAGFLGMSAPTLSILSTTGAFLGWTAAGHYIITPYVFTPATTWTSENIAQLEGTSSSYDTIKGEAYSKPSGQQWESIPDPAANNDTLQTLYGIRQNMVENGASKKQIAEINKAIVEAQKAGTYKVSEVPAVKTVFENSRNGKYGESVKEIFTNKSGTGTGMNRQGNYEQAGNLKQENIRANNQENIKNLKSATALVVAPFISSYFGNEALRLGAQIYDQDATNSIKVMSEK